MKRCLVILVTLLATMSVMAQPKREFRASWMTTVWAIDWPKSWGQNTESGAQKQQQEMRAIVDSLAVANMNAVFFQVRGFCDAMYNSAYEPWSKYLTGTRGGVPKYDPLQVLVDYAHAKGIEVHAWMNPYRYSTSEDTYGKLPDDYSNTHPEWLVNCGGYYILNPCMPEVKERIAAVVADLIGHYDVDGIIFDDYFYQSGYQNSYDDSYYTASGTKLSRADWRREQVNDMVRMVRDTIRATKPYVSFGIGPAGIAGTSSTSAPVYGVDPCPVGSDWQYNGIYSDPLAWYDRGLIDYMAPQCYWKIGAGNDYAQLSAWWSYIASHFNRHVYISQSIDGVVGDNSSISGSQFHADEIANQMQLDRDFDHMGAPGSCWYSLNDGMAARNYFRDIRRLANPYPAVVPMMVWYRTDKQLFVESIVDKDGKLSWTVPEENLRYAVYSVPADSVGYPGIVGSSRYLLGTTYTNSWPYKPSSTNTYAVAVLDRYGNEFPARTKGNKTFGESVAVQTMYPANGASVLLPCWFSWQPVDKADSYFFQLSKNSDFSTIDYECETIDPMFYIGHVEWLKDGVTYYWRLRTRGINSTDTYSPVQRFTGAHFHLISPMDDQRDCSTTLTVICDSVYDDNPTYTFEIASANTFASDKMVYSATASVPRVVIPDSTLLYSTYYFVRASVTYSGISAISNVVRFRTEAQQVPVPVIIAPVDGDTIVGLDVEVCWQQQASSGFRIELSTKESFPGRKTDVAEEEYTTWCHTFANVEPETYFIRVMAAADGAWTEPSEVVKIVVQTPTALRPVHATDKPAKVMRDGQLLIFINGEYFDMFGNRISAVHEPL